MMLNSLKNKSRKRKARKLLGRGPGSGHGKTSGRGHKGMGARSGSKKRLGRVGGGVPLHECVPTRGFSNVRFAKKMSTINLDQIEKKFQDGETVSRESICEKGFLSNPSPHGLKVLGKGNLTKKVKFQVEGFSTGALKKLKESGLLVE